MLQTNKLKSALKDGRPVFGLLNSIPSPLIVEMIGYAGYDFVILDMEHVGVNPETLENMIRAAEGANITPLVRVPSVAPDTIMRVLDCGAQGIVAPHIRNKADAEQAVAASRYHPLVLLCHKTFFLRILELSIKTGGRNGRFDWPG